MKLLFATMLFLHGAAHAASFDDWADRLANAKFRNAPGQATQAQYFSGKEQDGLDRRLTANTAAFRAAEAACGVFRTATRRMRWRCAG